MTTIAYTNGWIAADTCCSIGNYTSNSKKLYILPDVGVIGFAGSGTAMFKIADWWLDGCQGDAPTIDRDNDEGCIGLLVTRKGVFALLDGVHPMKIEDPWFAVGSGSDFAISAMSLGKNAKEAVEHAMQFDVGTGGSVDAIYCPNHFQKDKKKTKKEKKK